MLTSEGYFNLQNRMLRLNYQPSFSKPLWLIFNAFQHSASGYTPLYFSNVLRLTSTLQYDAWAQIAEGKTNAFIPESYQVAIAVAIQLCISECSLDRAAIDNLSEAGFSQVEIFEINNLVSVVLWFNTYTFAANLPIDESIRLQLRSVGHQK